MFSLVSIRYKGKQYDYLYTIQLSDYIGCLVTNKSKHIIYFKSSNQYVCSIIDLFIDKPDIQKLTFVGDCDDDTDYSDDDANNDDTDTDGIEKHLKSIVSSHISTHLIDSTHWDCVGTKVCGCGCDKLHSGCGSGPCEPYPYDSKHV